MDVTKIYNGKMLTREMLWALMNELLALNNADIVRCTKKTISYPGRIDCDYKFVSVNNANEQVITILNVVPAYSKVLDIHIINNEQWTSGVTFSTEIGSSSSGAEYANAVDIYASGAINGMAVAGSVAVVATTGHVYISSTPGANWNALTGGKMTVYITYIDFSDV